MQSQSTLETPVSGTTSLSPIDLLVIQPTPFCNLNCSYCYLPDRQNTKKIGLDVVEKIFERAFASSVVQRPFSVAWHAGEPLVLPISFYEEAIALEKKHNVKQVPVTHTVQTNGTTITPEWCAFFKKHGIRVGLSVDGPEFLHDLNRKRRNGSGTFKRVLETIRLLNQEQIPFTVISVLTSTSLEHPDALYDFYVAEGIRQVGFNIEEVEGPHQSSSMQLPDARRKFARFLSRFYDISRAENGPPKVDVREIHKLDSALRYLASKEGANATVKPTHSQEARPGSIISFDYLGNFATFSPELLGMPSKTYGDFSLGNVLSTGLDEAFASEKFKRMWRDVEAGIRKCEESCSYFAYCGGGSPVNKYYENGSFDSARTMVCDLSKQLRIDVLRNKIGVPHATDFSTLLAPSRSETGGRFLLPRHVRDSWWATAVAGIENKAPGALLNLARKVMAFTEFKGFAVAPTTLAEAVVFAPGRPPEKRIAVSGPGSALVNMGDSPLPVTLARASGAPEELNLDGGEGLWLAEGETATPSATTPLPDLGAYLALFPRNKVT